MDPVKILLVEDNHADAVIIGEMIREAGLPSTLTWFSDGQAGLDFLDSGNEVDLILLDLKLPKVDGHQFVKRLGQDVRMRHLPIIIMTGSKFPRDMELFDGTQVVDYIIKPMSVNEIELTSKRLKQDILQIDERRGNRIA